MPSQKETPSPQRPDAWTVATGQAARWIGLDLHLRAPRTWFGPTWAMLGGVLASGGLAFEQRSLILLAVAWLVSEPLLGSLAALSMEMARLRRECALDPERAPAWSLPYVQPGSPGRHLLDLLAAGAARLRWNWLAVADAGPRWALLALIAIALGAAVGTWVLVVALLAVLALLWMAATRPLEGEEREVVAAAHLLAAWLVGHGAFAAVDYRAFLVGLAFAGIWYAWTRRPPLLRMFAALHVLLAGLLAALHAPLAAGGVLLLAVPLVVLLPENASNQRSYLQHTQAFLMASLLLAAWGLVWPL